jgi:hypothetical protein
VAKMLKEKFNLDYYLAFKIQGLNDIMKITEELKASDYYLFIDFRRNGGSDLPCSLFTHQELALAYHVGFTEIIAFQEEGAPLEGFLRYVQANPEHFRNEDELLEKIEEMIRERKWSKDFLRNLVIEKIKQFDYPITYADHTGQHLEVVWHAYVENRRPDVAAVNVVCILDSIECPDGSEKVSPDRSYLKWARGYTAYQRTILPQDHGVVDLFAIHADAQGIYLHSQLDQMPRQPILREEGAYKLNYKLYSEGFPLLSFCVSVDYHHSTPTTVRWEILTHVDFVK